MSELHDIHDALQAFDGKRVAGLRALSRRPISAEGRALLLSEMPGPLESPASWVLKALAERGGLTKEELAKLFTKLPALTDTDAILHVLQLVQYHPMAARPLRDALVALAGHPRLLVNVWAFDAYCRTSDASEIADRDARIRQGLGHRSKAMQARARALAREFGVDLSP